MNQMTNEAGLSLAMAVWLAHDEYTNGSEDYPGMDVISATSLLKPTRQIVLTNRLPEEERTEDVSQRIKSQLGHAIHNHIEGIWKHDYASAMERLGYPKKVIDAIVINPDPDDVDEDCIPVYLEQRHARIIEVDGFEVVVTGKFDMVINGEMQDTKVTRTFTYTAGNKSDDYIKQGSIYRWLAPKIITGDEINIQHVFMDWMTNLSKTQKNYPPSQVLESKYQLLSEHDTEVFIRNKIRDIIQNAQLDEEDIVRCTDEELWKSEPQFKYYAKPETAQAGGRSTKNFDSYPAAAAHASKAGKGVVVTVPGEVKACPYCSGFAACSQRLEYGFDT